MIRINKAFNLEKGENIRELGNYATKDGNITRNKVYLRGGSTGDLTDNDIDILLDYGVNLEIDLRSAWEVDSLPSRLKDKLEYVNIPMLDGLASMEENKEMPSSMFQVYKNLLDNGREDFYRIFKLLLDNGGVSLFHCTAGKDRTGVLALLILGLAGVEKETILRDYEVSQDNLKRLINEQTRDYEKKTGKKIPSHFLESKRQDMEETINYLNETYGGIRSYLKGLGLREEELDQLNKKFIVEK